MSRNQFLITNYGLVGGESWMEREVIASIGAYVRDEIVTSLFYPILI